MPKFKVGQKVRCIGTSVRNNNIYHEFDDLGYGGGGWVNGFIFKIDRNTILGNRNVYWILGGSGVYEDYLELVEKPKVEPCGLVKFLESIEKNEI